MVYEIEQQNTDVRIHCIKIIFCYIAIASLFAGILIYVFFRNADLLVFSITGKIQLWENVQRYNADKNLFLNILAYNIPDGLWLLSCILFLRAIWLEQAEKASVYIFLFCTMAVVFEALQFFCIIPGTFDSLDIIVMVLTAFAEKIWSKNFLKRRLNYEC